MKTDFFLLTAVGLAMLACTNPISEPASPIYLSVDKTVYAPEDTVRVTLHNNSNAPLFLEGCNQLYLATKADTGWSEGVMWVCVWEGFAVKINPGSVFQRKFMAKQFSGVHKFVAPIYFECLDGKPISGAECKRQDKLYSPLFTVAGYEAAGILTIALPKSEYSWTSGDLGASRQIQATLRNNSDRTYYADIGDGFAGIDQENLYLAEGAGGFIERFKSDGSWSAMPGTMLIEGTRFVALRPQQSYRLAASLYHWRGDEIGFFRIKVEYFDQINPPPGTPPKVDYSQVFKIVSR